MGCTPRLSRITHDFVHCSVHIKTGSCTYYRILQDANYSDVISTSDFTEVTPVPSFLTGSEALLHVCANTGGGWIEIVVIAPLFLGVVDSTQILHKDRVGRHTFRGTQPRTAPSFTGSRKAH